MDSDDDDYTMNSPRFRNNFYLLEYIYADDIGKVKEAINLGADIHRSEDYPFRLACRHGNLEIMQLLYDLGANVNASNGSALRHACYRLDMELVRMLLKFGADVYPGHIYPLIIALDHPNRTLARILLAAKPANEAKLDFNSNTKYNNAIRVAVSLIISEDIEILMACELLFFVREIPPGIDRNIIQFTGPLLARLWEGVSNTCLRIRMKRKLLL
jgi:ankyrin repeat protein